jgi:hypothetical protein
LYILNNVFNFVFKKMYQQFKQSLFKKLFL